MKASLSEVYMTEQEIIQLIDDRVDMQTNIIMESSWFQEQVELAVKLYLLEKEALSSTTRNLSKKSMKLLLVTMQLIESLHNKMYSIN